MAPGYANLVARDWFYVTIVDVATVNFTKRHLMGGWLGEVKV